MIDSYSVVDVSLQGSASCGFIYRLGHMTYLLWGWGLEGMFPHRYLLLGDSYCYIVWPYDIHILKKLNYPVPYVPSWFSPRGSKVK